MTYEIPTSPAGKEPRFPSFEEVKRKIEQLCGKEDSEVVRTLEDGQGVYLYEVATVDAHGDASLYSYRRVGNYPESKVPCTLIDVAYCSGKLAEGMFVGGETLSNYDELLKAWVDIE